MKDTLQIYDDLIAGGCTEAQARAQAHQLGLVSEKMNDINQTLLKIDKDLLWMRIIGGAMTIAFMAHWFR